MHGVILASSAINDLWERILPKIEEMPSPDREVQRMMLNESLDEMSDHILEYINDGVMFKIENSYKTYTLMPWANIDITIEEYQSILDSFKEEIDILSERFNIPIDKYRLKLQVYCTYALVHKKLEKLVYSINF